MKMFDNNSEAGFVINSVFEFIKAWDSGVNSKLHLKSRNGRAWLNFTCNLGEPQDQHQKMKPKKAKSKKKQERDNLRAKLHQQKLQESNSSKESDLNNSMLVSAYHKSDPIVNSDIVEDEAAAAIIPLTEETIKGTIALYDPCDYDHSTHEADWCNHSHEITILREDQEDEKYQDSHGFRAHMSKMLDLTISKYALRKVEILKIEWGEFVDKGMTEWQFNHMIMCKFSVLYKQDQIRRYKYDRRAVPLAIAFRKEFDSDSDSRFIGLKYDNWRDEKTYQIREKICDPVILEDPSVATCDQFDAIIQLKETRRRAS